MTNVLSFDDREIQRSILVLLINPVSLNVAIKIFKKLINPNDFGLYGFKNSEAD